MSSPLDPEIIKVPAFKRKRSLGARSRNPIPWTALDRKTLGVSPETHAAGDDIPREVSSVRSVARSTRSSKRVLTPPIRDTGVSNFQRISLQQTSMLEEASDDQIPSAREYRVVGEVIAVLTKISVGILRLSQSVRLRDTLLFQGEEYMFEETISEMQINHKNVKTARKGSEIGLKMKRLPGNGTRVYRLV